MSFFHSDLKCKNSVHPHVRHVCFDVIRYTHIPILSLNSKPVFDLETNVCVHIPVLFEEEFYRTIKAKLIICYLSLSFTHILPINVHYIILLSVDLRKQVLSRLRIKLNLFGYEI